MAKESAVNLAEPPAESPAERESSVGSWHDRGAVVLCLVMLVIASGYASAHQIGTLGVETDFYGSYEPHARRILRGLPFTYRLNPPGYMILLAGVSLLTGGDFFLAGKILSVIASVVVVGLSYLIARALAGPAVALATALLSLIAIIPFSFIAATDLVGAAAILAAIWMIIRPTRRLIFSAAAAGALAGMAFLIRQNAIFLVAGGVICLLFLDPWSSSRRARLTGVAALVGGWLLLAAPWLVWNARHYGGPLSGRAHEQVAAHFFSPMGDAYGAVSQQMGLRFQSMSDVVRHDPVRVAKQYTRDVVLNYPRLLMQGLVRFPAYIFLGAGAVLLLLDLTRRRVAFALLCLLGYGLLGLVGYYTRLHLFLTPALFLPVAYFLFHPSVTGVMARTGLRRNSISWLLCAGIALLAGYTAFSLADQELADEPRHLIRAAEWLRLRAEPGDHIVSTKPHLSAFTGLGYSYSFASTPTALVDDLRRHRIRFLHVSDIDRGLPPYSELTDTTRAPDGLTLVYRDPSPLTLIYEVRGAR